MKPFVEDFQDNGYAWTAFKCLMIVPTPFSSVDWDKVNLISVIVVQFLDDQYSIHLVVSQLGLLG